MQSARAVTINWRYNRPPTANPGFALAPGGGTLRVPAGEAASATLTASASADASGTTPHARIDLTAAAGGEPEVRAGAVTWYILWHPGVPPPPAGDRDLVIYDGADVPPYATLLGSPENWGDEIGDRPVVEHATVKVETDGDAKRVTWSGTGGGQFYAQDDSPGTAPVPPRRRGAPVRHRHRARARSPHHPADRLRLRRDRR